MIKLIASDLDGTLLDQKSQISSENKEAIRKVLQQGLSFTLATGRMFQSTTPFARELELSLDQPLICYNGALIKRLSGEVLYHKPLPVDLALKIASYGQERGWTLNLYFDDQLYVAEINEQVETYGHTYRVSPVAVGDLVAFIQAGKKELAKILIISDPKLTSERLEEVKILVGDQALVIQTQVNFIEITNPDAHKGAALTWLAQFMGLTSKEVLAFGDGSNDLSMLKMAGVGIAMANAADPVKQVADYETKANYEHGVAYALHKQLGWPDD